MIEAIFFDAAGILYTRSGHTEDFALQLLRDAGYPQTVSEDILQKQLGLREQANEGRLGHEAYWDFFLAARGVADEIIRREYIHQIVTYSNSVDPIAGGREALAALKERGLRLGVITDTMYPLKWKWARLERARVADLIDEMVCSTDIGAHKPDPAVYAYALEKAGLQPGQAVFVGHLSTELEGAHRAGMLTVAITPDEEAQADFFCDSLAGLVNLPFMQPVQQPPDPS